MLKIKFIALMLISISIFAASCSSFSFSGNRAPRAGESEIIISCGSTIYNGRYIIFLNGEFRRTVKSKGGTVKYIVPNGQHIIMTAWQDNYGTSTEMTSIRVDVNSSRTFLFVTKTGSHEDISISFVDSVNLLQ